MTTILTAPTAADAGKVYAYDVITGRMIFANPLVINVKDPPFNAKGDAVTGDTAAIQAALDVVAASGNGILFFPAGQYPINDTLLLKDAVGVRLVGAGEDRTIISCQTSGTNGKPGLRIQDSRACFVENMSFYGNPAAPPSCAVNFHVLNPIVQTPTGCGVKGVRLGSNASNNFVSGIKWTCAAGHDVNNDVSLIEDVLVVNCSSYAFDITHSNSLLHRFVGCTIGSGMASGWQLAGGSFTAVGCEIACIGGTTLNLLPGTYHHPIHFVGCMNESYAQWMKADAAITDRVTILCSGSEFTGAPPGTVVIDWPIANSQLSFTSCRMETGQANTHITVSGGVNSALTMVGCTIGVTDIDYNGPVNLFGNSFVSSVTYTNQGSGILNSGRLDQIAAPTGPVAFGSQRITTLADPTGAQDGATKNYVDAAIAGVTAGAQVTSNAQIASYTLVLTDQGKAITMTVASANNLTVPPNSSVAFPVGTVIGVEQLGAGTTTIVAGAGVTINSRGSLLNLGGQYAAASLRKTATDVWLLAGDLV